MRNCIPARKILAIGLYRLAHANSYVPFAPIFNVGKSTVIEAVQDVVNVLFDQRDHYPGTSSSLRRLRRLLSVLQLLRERDLCCQMLQVL